MVCVLQVNDMTWADLQAITWPSGESLLTVAEAVRHVQDAADLLIIDVKTSADVNRVSRRERGVAASRQQQT